ncbi:hypothetical protein D3C72_1155790 [compost metagenome]
MRRFGTGCQYVGIVQTQDGGHAALPGRNGFLHQLATTLDELHRIAQAQTACRDQRAVFTQAVPGNVSRARTTFGQPQTPQGDRGGQNGWLGFIGLIELLFRPLLGQCPQVVTQSIGGFFECFKDNRMLRAQLGQHAEGLRTLSWKDECEGSRHVTSP